MTERSKLRGGHVDREQIRKVDRASRSYSTEVKRRKFVFYSSIDWKPMQSVKLRCKVVCPSRFSCKIRCIVLNLLKSFQKVQKTSREEGLTVVQTRKQKQVLVAWTDVMVYWADMMQFKFSSLIRLATCAATAKCVSNMPIIIYISYSIYIFCNTLKWQYCLFLTKTCMKVFPGVIFYDYM